jgi:hypothetical protein
MQCEAAEAAVALRGEVCMQLLGRLHVQVRGQDYMLLDAVVHQLAVRHAAGTWSSLDRHQPAIPAIYLCFYLALTARLLSEQTRCAITVVQACDWDVTACRWLPHQASTLQLALPQAQP